MLPWCRYCLGSYLCFCFKTLERKVNLNWIWYAFEILHYILFDNTSFFLFIKWRLTYLYTSIIPLLNEQRMNLKYTPWSHGQVSKYFDRVRRHVYLCQNARETSFLIKIQCAPFYNDYDCISFFDVIWRERCQGKYKILCVAISKVLYTWINAV